MNGRQMKRKAANPIIIPGRAASRRTAVDNPYEGDANPFDPAGNDMVNPPVPESGATPAPATPPEDEALDNTIYPAMSSKPRGATPPQLDPANDAAKEASVKYPVKCLACGQRGKLSGAKLAKAVTSPLRCKCGSTDIDLDDGPAPARRTAGTTASRRTASHDPYAESRSFTYRKPAYGEFTEIACTVPGCGWSAKRTPGGGPPMLIDKWVEHALANRTTASRRRTAERPRPSCYVHPDRRSVGSYVHVTPYGDGVWWPMCEECKNSPSTDLSRGEMGDPVAVQGSRGMWNSDTTRGAAFTPGEEAGRRAYDEQQAEMTRSRERNTRRLLDAYRNESDREYADEFYGDLLRERGIDPLNPPAHLAARRTALLVSEKPRNVKPGDVVLGILPPNASDAEYMTYMRSRDPIVGRDGLPLVVKSPGMGVVYFTDGTSARAKSVSIRRDAATRRTSARGPQVLVAMDWGDEGLSPQPVLDFLDRFDALLDYSLGTTPHFRSGEPITAHRFTFDASKIRNTDVHAAGFQAGFVVHIEDGGRTASKGTPGVVAKIEREILSTNPGLSPTVARQVAARTAARMAPKTAMPNPVDLGVKVGDFFVASWGYDQTNVDFYEVVGLTAASVRVVPVGKRVVSENQNMTHVVPVPGDFQGEVMTKRVQGGRYEREDPSIKIDSYSTARLWDGEPRYETAQGWGH